MVGVGVKEPGVSDGRVGVSVSVGVLAVGELLVAVAMTVAPGVCVIGRKGVSVSLPGPGVRDEVAEGAGGGRVMTLLTKSSD